MPTTAEKIEKQYAVRVGVRNGPVTEVSYDQTGFLGVVETKAMFMEVNTARTHLAVRVLDDSGKGDLRKEGNARHGKHVKRTARFCLAAEGRFCTQPGENDIRVALVDESGYLTYVQYSIVSQVQKAWLIQQVKAAGQLYRDNDGKIVMVEKVRPQLLEILNSVQRLKELTLPSSGKMPAMVEEPAPTFREGEGEVMWYDETRQAGAIELMHQGHLIQAKVHFSECPVRTAQGWRGLAEGERVKVGGVGAVTDHERSKFKHEAKQVTLGTHLPHIQ